ncbi:ABC transporter ATP-binding protein [Cryobacterium sp. Y50]|uniref:ABC transporter ATP-binding protein n=1 Tax=Cryobacterium sp. Y50 TaxID=2048286 RepID=UPI000CE4A53C|nr:ABC transporter ATP-binding protein [Cryobacterium sp. Y50]
MERAHADDLTEVAAGLTHSLDELSVSVTDLTKVFRRGNREVTALDGVNFTARPGEFVTVLGPSGCGKSTLLHILGGFESASTGSVEVFGKSVTGPGRERGMVFQSATLFPWWTIQRNVAWPLEVGGMGRKASRARADDLLELVGLTGFGDAYPGELSGGMQQRAGIARTLSLEPQVLLMDEPFGALDAQTRELMQEELNRIWQASGTTVVFITHDIYEAVFLGDRVLVMSGRPGRIVADISIDLPRPRGHDVKGSPEFSDYHARLWNLLRDEAIASEFLSRD